VPEREAPERWHGAEPGPGAEEAPPSQPGGVVGRSGSADDSIPDDYAMMSGDCAELGKQLAALTRSDQAVQLSPKLTAQQRAQAEKNIDDVATKLGAKWSDTCEKSLVGKSVDRRSLKCAMDAKTVKDFDACLNSTAAPPK
jgi:hypothetical protein